MLNGDHEKLFFLLLDLSEGWVLFCLCIVDVLSLVQLLENFVHYANHLGWVIDKLVIELRIPLLEMRRIDLKKVIFQQIKIIILQSFNIDPYSFLVLILTVFKLFKKVNQLFSNSLCGNIGAPNDVLVLLALLILVYLLDHVGGLALVVWVDFSSHAALALVE